MRSESALRVQWSPRLVWLVHRASAVLLVLFAVPHLVNHLFALRGPAAHIAVMEAMRSVYRHPLAEGLLLVAVAVQVLTGAWQLWVARGRTPSRLTRVKRWRGWSWGFSYSSM